MGRDAAGLAVCQRAAMVRRCGDRGGAFLLGVMVRASGCLSSAWCHLHGWDADLRRAESITGVAASASAGARGYAVAPSCGSVSSRLRRLESSLHIKE